VLKQTPDFTHNVWEAADLVGRNAPRIVDYIVRSLFPNTFNAAEAEGASRILRIGCIAEVKRVLHRSGNNSPQAHVGEVHGSFLPLVRALQRPSYFVPELDEEVPVRELIADPALLDGARRFMRLKGMQCLDEAERLDRLYEAVTGQSVNEPAELLRDAIRRTPDVRRPIPPWER
jgi:hypothetical protein